MLQWLQVFGRFHMLVIHLPIGLLAGLAAVEFSSLVRCRPPAREVTGPLVWLAAASAVLAAAMGYVLSFESGYGGDVLTQHLYLGLALAGVCLLAAALHARKRPLLFRCSLVVALVLLIPTGHLGGTMTHGEDFLTGPLRAPRLADPSPPSAELTTAGAPIALTFATAVAPIFEARCWSCHGPSRTKGGLALHTPEAIGAGGEHGPVILASDPGASELLRRLRLPADHDDHMPPESKPQPTPEEVAAIESWIAAGAPFDAPFSLASPGNPTLSAGAAPTITPDVPVPGAFATPSAPPSAANIAAVRSRLAHVEPVESGSTLLWIDFAAAAPTITDADVEALLAPIGAYVADLRLSRSAISDRALAAIGRMPNLRRLDLRSTGVTDAGIAALRSHSRLEELILAQTGLTDAVVDELAAMPSLKRVNLWRSGVSPEAAVKLSARRDSLVVETGDRSVGAPIETEDAVTLTGDAPVGAPASDPAGVRALKPFNSVCPVSGKAVDPDYVIIHRGRIIGFCCRHCAEQYWIDPAKFAKALGDK